MADSDTPKYLLGGGERLSSDIPRPPRGMGEKAHPYSFAQARRRLQGQGEVVNHGLRALPPLALPANEAVIGLTLHPSYLAKSYYPSNLLKECGLRHMGSRAVHIRPEKLVTQKALDDDRPLLAPLIYVAGDVEDLASFTGAIGNWQPADAHVEDDFRKIETLALPGRDRLKPLAAGLAARKGALPLEIVLHVDEDDEGAILDAFNVFAASLGVEVLDGYTRQVGGLAFLAARGVRSSLEPLLDFTFLRALRGMPTLKPFEPALRSARASFRVQLPDADALAPDLAVAIFDGGLPSNHGLDRWVTLHEPADVGAPLPGGSSHGLGVTSAFLFGPLEEGVIPGPPPATVEHWRVIGDDTLADDFALLPVLARIENVLSSRAYDFINISMGPDITIEDDDVTAWTSTLDALLADGETVATVACGNNGEADRDAGLHRVQPPSDGVNIVSVGAASRPDTQWRRAPYSAWGPGRSPGFVKPDLITFGGSTSSPFLMLDAARQGTGFGNQGTSFAAPLVMRCAAGVRAQFAEHLWAPTIKALLIHHAEAGDHPREEVGWGCLPHGVGDLVLCRDGEAHVLYQRQMPPQGSVRMELPVPSDVHGRIEIRGTFCIYSDVDPEDALNYTRGGLEIAFRPDSVTLPEPYEKDGRVIEPTVPKTSGFFSSEELYSTEFARRDDAHKWETVFTRTKRMNSSSLNRPVFDVSYAARAHGHTGRRAPHMKVALVLTLRHAKTRDLYDRVVRTAAGRLQPMRPRPGLAVPTRVRV
ncbi:peptidase S8 and S53, subtilisin, kexin, sedolisin [Phenylobacterium hankyongense]|uniref:Peptidase S8 and S53, subtilisin, kexin, sedolisin n=1 Tax=Phenylobacterium hankyongense TaxID=1813876 RepID=A0A328AYA2_9CAUL|nr:S8 family peptidase [Phenylobacterium hankyongense]RAK60092.1 peptidase S8 and S53, subtilisin, kexin, sedolisin [Phenylobacterium hankyongense]